MWYILWPFGILYGPLVYLVALWYIFRGTGTLYQEKSGNPANGSKEPQPLEKMCQNGTGENRRP
jgi:hypothetical protein